SVVSYDSELVWLTAFDNGEKSGSLSSPKDAKKLPNGRARLQTDWLARYAKTPASAKILSEGVRADFEVAEEVLDEIGKPLGINEPLYIPEQDEEEKFLNFLPEKIPETPAVPARLDINGYPLEVHGFMGKPFHSHVNLSLTGTPKTTAMEVIFGGSGVKLIDLQALDVRRVKGN